MLAQNIGNTGLILLLCNDTITSILRTIYVYYNEQLKVLMSEEFIYLTIDFVEQAWRKRQSIMFN